MITEAQFYSLQDDNTVQCSLCPHNCILREGKSGICQVRTNQHGRLMSEVYGIVSALHIDPIEKKPLYHFCPGSTILSIGTYGCNLKCSFCQNCNISQINVQSYKNSEPYSPQQIIALAGQLNGNIGIAFTYNEPIVWFEYMYDIALLAKQAGLKTVMVTNGYINPEPLKVILPVIDAFSVDLKAFNEEFYKSVTYAHLEPVKDTLQQIREAGKHLEVVNLVIPQLNDEVDSFAEMVIWIACELGKETVFHISRYFPNHKLTNPATPMVTIEKLRLIANAQLTYVYTGNIADQNNHTYCTNCHSLLVERYQYHITTQGLDNEGNCKICGNNFLKKI